MKKHWVLSLTLATTIFCASFGANAEAQALQYKVQPGDTLWKVSTKFKTTIPKLKQWNRLKADKIQVGQVLIVSPGAPQSTAKPANVHIETDQSSITYTVKSGDSLFSIAKARNTTVDAIRTLNKLNTNSIKKGQQLLIPSQTGFLPPSSTQLATIHKVQSGDTLWIIANKYGVSVVEIKYLNGLNTDVLYIGQELKITEGAIPPPKTPAFLADAVFPLAKESYTPFGDTWGASRQFGRTRTHEGTDIIAPKGTAVYSATGGTIVNFGWSQLGGWRISVKSPEGYHLYYAHLSKYAPGVGIGKKLSKGQVIGYVGDSGYGPEGTTGKFVSHLHFGLYDSKWKAINPYDHLRYWQAKL